MDYPEVYCALHQGTEGDLAFYIKQCQRIQQTIPDRTLQILELGCGAGRLSIPLAKQGFHVTGVDLSSTLLTLANVESKRIALSVDQLYLLEADICQLKSTLEAKKSFDVVIIAYNTLYCLANYAQQQAVLQHSLDYLRPNGYLLCDAYQLPDPNEYSYETNDEFEPLTVLSYQSNQWPFHESSLLNIDDPSLIHVGIEERDDYQQDQQRCTIEYLYRWLDQSKTYVTIHHCYLYVNQLSQLFTKSGFTIERLSDHFTEHQADCHSEHWSCIAQPKDV